MKVIDRLQSELETAQEENRQLRDLVNSISTKMRNTHCDRFNKLAKYITDEMRKIYCQDDAKLIEEENNDG